MRTFQTNLSRLIVSALVLALAACHSSREKQLIVGMELGYPPFEMTDRAGQPAGVSVDLAHALGGQLGRPVRIENIPFDGLIPALKSGKIDLVISSMTATPERAQSIDFSEPYLTTGLCILAGAGTSIQSAADLDRAGVTVAVKKGTTGHTWAAQNLKQAALLVLDKESACVLEVVQGKAGAFLYDQMSVLAHWRKNQAATRALLRPFREEKWAVGIRKGNVELREKVNAFLADFRARGGFEELGDRHLKEQKEAFRALGIPFVF